MSQLKKRPVTLRDSRVCKYRSSYFVTKGYFAYALLAVVLLTWDCLYADLLVIREGNKYGYVDKSGNIIIEPQFRDANEFSEGLAAVVRMDSTWGYIDSTGNFILTPDYFVGREFSEGLAVVWKEYKAGYINKNGTLVIACKFDNAFEFSEGAAAVKAAGKWGYVDKTGEYIIRPRFDLAGQFNGGVATVGREDGRLNTWDAVIRKDGTQIVAVSDTLTDISQPGKGLIGVTVNGRQGRYIDLDGKLAIFNPFIFSFPGTFADGLAPVTMSAIFIDENGLIKLNPTLRNSLDQELEGMTYLHGQFWDQYGQQIPYTAELLRIADMMIKFGGTVYEAYIDSNGTEILRFDIHEILSPKMSDVTSLGEFSEGLASITFGDISSDCKCGYIDKTGKSIIAAQFNVCQKFQGGVARVQILGRDGIIDWSGNLIWLQKNPRWTR